MLFQIATWKLFMHHWKDNCLRMRVVQDQSAKISNNCWSDDCLAARGGNTNLCH